MFDSPTVEPKGRAQRTPREDARVVGGDEGGEGAVPEQGDEVAVVAAADAGAEPVAVVVEARDAASHIQAY